MEICQKNFYNMRIPTLEAIPMNHVQRADHDLAFLL